MKFNCDEKQFEKVIFSHKGKDYPFKDFSYATVTRLTKAQNDNNKGKGTALIDFLAEILEGMTKEMIKSIDARHIAMFNDYINGILLNPESSFIEAKKKT